MFCPKTRYRPNSCFHIHVRLGHYYAHSAEGNSQQSNLHGTHKKFFEKNAIVEQFEDEKRCPKKNLKDRNITLLTEEQTNLQPRTMWLSNMVKSPRDSGYLDCSFNTKRVMVIKSVRIASPAWSIFPPSASTPPPPSLHIWNRSCLYNIIILVFLLQSSHFLLSFIFILARGVAHKAE